MIQQQQAKPWKLRAVMRLSRLWQQQGKKEEARQSNRDGCALKRRERQAGKVLIVSRTEVSQNADSHRLAEFEPLNNVRPPMDPSGITAKADVGRQLVQFPTHRQRRPCIGQKREPVGAGHHPS